MAHDRTHHWPFERISAAISCGENEHQLIAIHAASELIDHDHPIAVAVERDSNLRAHPRHRELQQLRRHRAAAIVDVTAVRRAADGDDFSAQIAKHARGHLVAGAVGAIDDNFEALQAHAGRNGRSAEILILGPAAVDAYGLAQALRFLREHREVQQTLDLLFYAVRELAARAIEEFDAIVLVG